MLGVGGWHARPLPGIFISVILINFFITGVVIIIIIIFRFFFIIIKAYPPLSQSSFPRPSYPPTLCYSPPSLTVSRKSPPSPPLCNFPPHPFSSECVTYYIPHHSEDRQSPESHHYSARRSQYPQRRMRDCGSVMCAATRPDKDKEHGKRTKMITNEVMVFLAKSLYSQYSA